MIGNKELENHCTWEAGSLLLHVGLDTRSFHQLNNSNLYQNVSYCSFIQEIKKSINVTGPKYKVVADGLYINNVTLEDKGEYTCRAFQLSPTISNMLERIIVLKIEREYSTIQLCCNQHYEIGKLPSAHHSGY